MVEVVRNIIVSGGRFLVIIDCLNYGFFDKLEVFWELLILVDGIVVVCEMLGIFVILGNVFLYNEMDG